ncbi:hypothetical protein [Methanocaldococcus sp.]
MDVFLDTCIIISYHIPCHPHHKKVLEFYKNNNVNSQVTCEKVKEEVDRKLNQILMEFKKSNSISDLDIRKIRHAINKFFRKIQLQDFSRLDRFLFNDLDIELGEFLKNPSDREIFANAILWNISYNPNDPYFLTLDRKDYRNTWGIMLAVSNCLRNNGHDINNLKKLIEIVIL